MNNQIAWEQIRLNFQQMKPTKRIWDKWNKMKWNAIKRKEMKPD